MILAIDLGTTAWKAGLINDQGQLFRIARMPTPVILEDGFPCYSARDMAAHLAALFTQLGPLNQVSALAFTGMAEAGLIIDRRTMEPRSSIWPWFDRRATPAFEASRNDPRFAGRPAITGLPESPKYGIYKLLTLLGRESGKSVLWIGLVAYAASLLTGECAEDHSLAARTGCLILSTREWDAPFLASLGLGTEVFPRLIPQGGMCGTVQDARWGLSVGTPVCIGGHDHLCATYGLGALQKDALFISTGTAQVVLGLSDGIRPETGLSYGPSPAAKPYTCLGSIQSAGGSVNFWKDRLFPQESYETLVREAAEAPANRELMYFPYLSGSGAPHLDPHASGALLGLRDNTSRGSIIAAVYEGLAFETRYLTEAMQQPPIAALACAGGLTRHPRYMQTLADVLGTTVVVPDLEEAALYGAARLAAEKLSMPALPDPAIRACYNASQAEHRHLSSVYRQRYLPLMRLMRTED